MHPHLVDYHCHLDLYPDYESAFAECCREEVETLTMTTTPRAWERNKELASHCPLIRVALGLHPQLVAEGHDDIALFERLLPDARYVGEVGLDASPRYYKSFRAQQKIFERILCSCAEHGNKIISVHAVRATRDVLALIEKYLPPNKGKVVLHWFTGSKAEAKRAVDLGCYFSINGEMLKSETRREIVTSLPIERILTETDGPFTLIENRPSMPSDVITTVNNFSRGVYAVMLTEGIKRRPLTDTCHILQINPPSVSLSNCPYCPRDIKISIHHRLSGRPNSFLK